MKLDLATLASMVASRDLSALIGETENEYFDVKTKPYRLDQDSDRQELAKDISAFANANGGFIFLGFRTQKEGTHTGDTVVEARPIPQEVFNREQYHAVVQAWVYPDIHGVVAEWIPAENSPERGFVAIQIPAQLETTKPFLLSRTLNDAGRQNGRLFGLVERKRDATKALTLEDLHQALRRGLGADKQIFERLDAMQASIEMLSAPKIDPTVEASSVKSYALASLAVIQATNPNSRVFLLTARPTPPSTLQTFLSEGEGSIRRILQEPPVIRENGWDMRTVGRPQLVENELLRVTNTGRKIVELHRNGVLTFAAHIDEYFLAWDHKPGLRLNPLALAEVVLSFCLLYERVLRDLRVTPKSVEMVVEMHSLHFNEKRTFLPEGPVGSRDWEWGTYDRNEAPSDQLAIKIDVAVSDFSSPRVSYALLREIYAWFGYAEESVPYTSIDAEGPYVDAEKIRNPKSALGA